MQFTTLIFALFFLVTLTGNWLLARFRIWQKLFLLLASYCFYAAANWKLLAVLLVSSLLNYMAGELIASTDGKFQRRAWLISAVTCNLLLLGVFKYYGFFVDSIAALLEAAGLHPQMPTLEILLPIGISFYTFQGLSYIVDLYRRQGMRANSMLDFLLFIAFFPKLLSGPICRAKELLPQLSGEHPCGVANLSGAAALILSGLFKKVVLATLMDTHLVLKIFDAPENFSTLALWAAMFGYAFLLYWDFSGYTDLARGLAQLLGFSIPENFNHPYIATDISDFWRRWHITLSNWLRDYLFVPLGGLHIRKRWSAVVLTMVLAGLWHGAGWTYVIWGTFHGVMLFMHHLFRSGIKRKWRGGWLGTAGTFLLVCLGWVMFRAANLPAAVAYYKRMFSFAASGSGIEAIVLALILLGIVLHLSGARLRRWFVSTSELIPLPLRPVLWFAVGMFILALKPAGIAPYIYFGF
jgi:alginate O-acetyltransferase complex protein AlgI